MKYCVCFFLSIVILFSFRSAVAQNEAVYWIAYVASSHQDSNDVGCTYGLCIIRSDGNSARRLTEDIAFGSPLSWSYDGSSLAYVNGKGDLYRFEVDKEQAGLIVSQGNLLQAIESIENKVSIPENTNFVQELIWSSDGKELFFRLQSDLATGIYATTIKDGRIREIIKTSNSSYAHAISLSPDSEWIGYLEKSLCASCDPYNRLYRVKPDGSDIRLLSDDSFRVGNFSWSADGERIYYSYLEQDKTWSIYSITADGNDKKLLFDDIAKDADILSIAATSHYIFFTTSEETQYQKMYDVDTEGRNFNTIPEADLLGDGFSQISVSPDDRIVAVGTDFQAFGTYGTGLLILYPNGESYQIAGYPILDIVSPVVWSPISIQE
jgi:Tol biopolymer transport system component